MEKPREFWIHNFPKNQVTPWKDEPVAYRSYSNVVDLPGGFWSEKNTIHVIEVTPLTQNAGELLEALNAAYEDYVKYNDCAGTWDVVENELLEHSEDCLKCKMLNAIKKAEGGDEN